MSPVEARSAPQAHRHPAVRLLAGHALAATAMSMPWPVLLAEVWNRTGSDTWLGVAGAARLLPYVLLSAAAGMVADRFAGSRSCAGPPGCVRCS